LRLTRAEINASLINAIRPTKIESAVWKVSMQILHLGDEGWMKKIVIVQNGEERSSAEFDTGVPIVEKAAAARVAEVLHAAPEFSEDERLEIVIGAAIFNDDDFYRDGLVERTLNGLKDVFTAVIYRDGDGDFS
jgi:hypothetical protein